MIYPTGFDENWCIRKKTTFYKGMFFIWATADFFVEVLPSRRGSLQVPSFLPSHMKKQQVQNKIFKNII